jgi:hypothetical protein
MTQEPAEPGTAPAAAGAEAEGRARRTELLLRWVRNVGVADLVLLAALLVASFTGSERGVDVLGPIHGVGYLVLVGLVVIGVLNRLWGWWFPLLVLLTAGAVGALAGERLIRGRLGRSPDGGARP